jgi:DNA-directed RNA polymerase subunit RPC12/RpoP
MEDNEYKCAWCGGVFLLVKDETWSKEKADKEYLEYFPNASMENRDIVCDDCWNEVKPDKPQ